MTANILLFRAGYRAASTPERDQTCEVIILPVVRIERNPETPHDAMVDDYARRTGRRRRRVPLTGKPAPR